MTFTIRTPERGDFPDTPEGLAEFQKSLLEYAVAAVSVQENDAAVGALKTLNPARYADLGKADPAPGPTPVRPVQAIDVSSNNGPDIGRWIDRLDPEHVIVKLYQSVERGLDRYTIAQAQTAKAKGKTVGGYVWLYAGIPGERQVQDALDVARRAGIDLPILWLDCEQYTDGSDPNGDTIRQAVAAAALAGVKVGIYTGAWWWDGTSHPLRGSTEFHELPLWYADYARAPTLDVPDFGGWMMAAAHQYTSTPIDRSIIRSDLAGL